MQSGVQVGFLGDATPKLRNNASRRPVPWIRELCDLFAPVYVEEGGGSPKGILADLLNAVEEPAQSP